VEPVKHEHKSEPNVEHKPGAKSEHKADRAHEKAGTDGHETAGKDTHDKLKHTDAVREVDEVQKPGANGPRGNLVWRDNHGYHQMRCVDGKVVDAQHKTVGEIKDSGDLVIAGKSFKIESAQNKSEYMFLGNNSDGQGTKFIPPQDQKLMSGMLASIDKTTTYA